MPVTIPPASAIREFLGATTRHTRRVEIYESDGSTRWAKDIKARLVGGQVTVDYSREERRAIDLTLSNTDGVLVNAPGGFWYDKIIKVYRGVEVREPARLPKVLIIADATGTDLAATRFKSVLLSLGFGDVRINTIASNYSIDIAPYDIIVGLGGGAGKGALLKQAYQSGKSVFAYGSSALTFLTSTFGAAVTSSVAFTSSEVTALSITHPVALGWPAFPVKIGNYSPGVAKVTNPEYVAIANATSTLAGATAIGAMNEPSQGGRAVVMNWHPTPLSLGDVNFAEFLRVAFSWLNTVIPLRSWEVQIGEFMIDRISESHYPHNVKVTGRDYTKKCLLSKFTQATQFATGQKLETLIGTIAGAAGITKRLLPATGILVGKTFFFERGIDRWSAMKDIANAYNYEIFFDATGYLVLRPYADPALTAPSVYIETGPDGIVASYEKSTTDTRIYNHILVTGESSDANILPVWAEAKNESPTSPTSIQDIGDRVYEYTSSFIQTKVQAQQVADSFLAVHSLEEFELSFTSLLLPWLEAGDIMGWIDPNPAPGDPNAFLISSLTLPLELGPMSGLGKRVTNVG